MHSRQSIPVGQSEKSKVFVQRFLIGFSLSDQHETACFIVFLINWCFTITDGMMHIDTPLGDFKSIFFDVALIDLGKSWIFKKTHQETKL